MNNKVLIKLIVPDFDDSFDIFIPVNELVWKVKKLIVKTIGDITSVEIVESDDCVLINKTSSRVYKNNEVIIDTDIRNGSEIILISHL